jgi:hypothetical protein
MSWEGASAARASVVKLRPTNLQIALIERHLDGLIGCLRPCQHQSRSAQTLPLVVDPTDSRCYRLPNSRTRIVNCVASLLPPRWTTLSPVL